MREYIYRVITYDLNNKDYRNLRFAVDRIVDDTEVFFEELYEYLVESHRSHLIPINLELIEKIKE